MTISIAMVIGNFIVVYRIANLASEDYFVKISVIKQSVNVVFQVTRKHKKVTSTENKSKLLDF